MVRKRRRSGKRRRVVLDSLAPLATLRHAPDGVVGVRRRARRIHAGGRRHSGRQKSPLPAFGSSTRSADGRRFVAANASRRSVCAATFPRVVVYAVALLAAIASTTACRRSVGVVLVTIGVSNATSAILSFSSQASAERQYAIGASCRLDAGAISLPAVRYVACRRLSPRAA